MARSQTSRRPAHRRTGQLDRPAGQLVPFDASSPTPFGNGTTGDSTPVPESSATPDQGPQPLSPQINPWAELPEAERQRLGRHFSRLVLLAIQSSVPASAKETL